MGRRGLERRAGVILPLNILWNDYKYMFYALLGAVTKLLII